MREVTLTSGAVLKIGQVPFETSKALYQAVLEELKSLKINSEDQLAQLYKDIFCVGFSSKKIEAALWDCFKRCQYCDSRGDLKIDKDTFEPVSARADYVQVCVEVMKENIDPFAKGLFAEYKTLAEIIASNPQ